MFRLFLNFFILILFYNTLLAKRYYDIYSDEQPFEYAFIPKKTYHRYNISLRLQNLSYTTIFKYGSSYDNSVLDAQKDLGFENSTKVTLSPVFRIKTTRNLYIYKYEYYDDKAQYKLPYNIKFANVTFEKDDNILSKISFSKHTLGYRRYLNSYVKIGFDAKILQYKVSISDNAKKEYVNVTSFYPIVVLDLQTSFSNWLVLYASVGGNTSDSYEYKAGFKYIDQRKKRFWNFGYRTSQIGINDKDLDILTKYNGIFLGYGVLF